MTDCSQAKLNRPADEQLEEHCWIGSSFWCLKFAVKEGTFPRIL
jgi:hypothetical protein